MFNIFSQNNRINTVIRAGYVGITIAIMTSFVTLPIVAVAENNEHASSSQDMAATSTQDGDVGEDGSDGHASSTETSEKSEEDLSDTGDHANEENGATEDEEADHATSSNTENDVDNENGSSTDITTGDATSSGDVMNESNTNEYNSNTNEYNSNNLATSSPTSSTSTPHATSTGNGSNGTTTDNGNGADNTSTTSDNHSSHAGTSTDTNISNSNNATHTNSAMLDATTGENTASSTAGTTTIDTGDATATTDVVNQVNTNIINSRGFILFLSQLFSEGNDDIDLRAFDFFTPQDTQFDKRVCTSCESGNATTTIANTNNAAVQNDVVVNASTGNNIATSEGTSSVTTGDAYAAANVVTLANTNIVDSNYLFLTFNSFGEWAGDMIFPNSEAFSEMFSASGTHGNTTAPGDLDVHNSNNAHASNTVSVNADTGINTATGSSSQVKTGEAKASANVINMLNTNITNGDSFTILFRVHGDFDGELHNAPEGVSLVSSGDGLYQLVIESTSGDESGSERALSVNNTNNATITNSVNVSASTGGNAASGSSSEVSTGDAHAAANVINVANTNVVGRNWMTAIVNIFGDWSGNVSFGRPDLWVGAQASVPNNLQAGSEIDYHLTVANNGDATAHDVTLSANANHPFIEFKNDDGDYVHNPQWSIGTLEPDEVVDVTYDARIVDDLPYGDTSLTTHIEADAKESDENMEDNTEEITFIAHRSQPSRSGQFGGHTDTQTQEEPASEEVKEEGMIAGASRSAPPAVIVKKERFGADEIYASSSVDYSITIDNSYGGPVYGAVLYDTLTDESGNIIHEEAWSFDTIHEGEVITLDYSVEFSSSTDPGIYTNTAQVLGYGGLASSTAGYEYDSMTATASVRVFERPTMIYEAKDDTSKKNVNEVTDIQELPRIFSHASIAYAQANSGENERPNNSEGNSVADMLISEMTVAVLMLAMASAGVVRFLHLA